MRHVSHVPVSSTLIGALVIKWSDSSMA